MSSDFKIVAGQVIPAMTVSLPFNCEIHLEKIFDFTNPTQSIKVIFFWGKTSYQWWLSFNPPSFIIPAGFHQSKRFSVRRPASRPPSTGCALGQPDPDRSQLRRTKRHSESTEWFESAAALHHTHDQHGRVSTAVAEPQSANRVEYTRLFAISQLSECKSVQVHELLESLRGAKSAEGSHCTHVRQVVRCGSQKCGGQFAGQSGQQSYGRQQYRPKRQSSPADQSADQQTFDVQQSSA